MAKNFILDSFKGDSQYKGDIFKNINIFSQYIDFFAPSDSRFYVYQPNIVLS